MIYLLLISFLGYLTGRFGHVYLNVWTGNVNWLPHHWVYGIVLTGYGIIHWSDLFAQYIFFFGLGLFISDLRDFLKLRFFQPDKEGPKKFWDID